MKHRIRLSELPRLWKLSRAQVHADHQRRPLGEPGLTTREECDICQCIIDDAQQISTEYAEGNTIRVGPEASKPYSPKMI